MANYYYLVSSLPMLRPDSGDYMSFEEFLSICKDKVSKRDYAMLCSASINGSDEDASGSKFLRSFVRFRSIVEKSLASARAEKLQIKDERYKNEGERDSAVTDAVRRAVNAESPLEGERIVIALYWAFLDGNVGVGHYFDMDFLLSYALRLQLLKRMSLFTEERGNEEFGKLFGELKKEIFQ